MLDPDEAAAVAEQFGVSEPQVRRDHLISHLLAALSQRLGDRVVFFGGTALARAYLPDGRLSEDIDLLARDATRTQVAAEIETTLPRGVRREYPGLTWQPPLTAVRQHEPAVLLDPEGSTVRVQLLDQVGYPSWPLERRDLHQRYSDAAPARLLVPTVPALVAGKTMAWLDRHAARDLFDLWQLAETGAITAAAAELFARHGPTGRPPHARLLGEAPTEEAWLRDVGAQTRLRVTAATALQTVRQAWTRVAASH